MTNYAKLSKQPQKFLDMTGYTLEEFQALLPSFAEEFEKHMKMYTLEGKKRQNSKYIPYKSSPLPTIEDKLLFILVYLKQYSTQTLLSELFNMTQPKANQWIHLLLPLLNKALDALGKLPARNSDDLKFEEDETTFFHDGTERPINRPQDPEEQKSYYSGKKKQHTVCNNVLINLQCIVLFLSMTCEGKKHDKKIADESELSLPQGSILLQDTGFQGFTLDGVSIVQPKKKPRNGELTDDEIAQNSLISSIRIRVEHAICGVKRYRIVKDKIRLWKRNIRDLVLETCVGLHNFRLDFRPWNYKPIALPLS